VASEDFGGLDLVKKFPGFASELDESVQLVGHLFGKALLSNQLFLDLLPWFFVKFVDARADGFELAFLAARKLHHRVQKLPMIHLNLEVADVKSLENLLNNGEHLSVRDHQRVVSSDIEIALVELSETAFAHLRLITSVDLSNVEALYL
jgi:hypothetical protein